MTHQNRWFAAALLQLIADGLGVRLQCHTISRRPILPMSGQIKTHRLVTFTLKHVGPGVLSMANSGPHSNGSQFFITTGKADWLDGVHVVFGCINDQRSLDVLRRMEAVGSVDGQTSEKVIIAECGQIKKDSP